MRTHGSRFEPMLMKPHDHIGWVFSGPGEFAALAEPFLAEGAALNERLMYVAEDPQSASFGAWTEDLYPGTLTTASIGDVYGESGVVDARQQEATFAQVLAEALAQGFSGIRVAADNTPLVLDPKRLESWVNWEIAADHFMAENRVTGLCAFDRTRVDVNTLRDLATMHPISQEEDPRPPFRVFTDDGALRLEGDIGTETVGRASLALEHLPAHTPVIVSLANAGSITSAALAGLRQLCGSGVAVTVEAAEEIVQRLRLSIDAPVRNLSWSEV